MAFDLGSAVSLLGAQRSSLNALWAFYAAGCWGAAGFSQLPERRNRKLVALVVTIGFWILAMGHLDTLISMLKVNVSLGQHIEFALTNAKPPDAVGFREPLALFAQTSVTPCSATVAHLAIDLCVTAILWARVLVKA